MDHQNNFNLLRLLAAMEVVYVHCLQHLKLPGSLNWFWYVVSQFPGVACFFIISGFLVSGSYLRNPIAVSFFAKRALRIYPALIVNILVLELAIIGMGCVGITSGARYFGLYLPIYFSTASTIFAEHVAGSIVNFSGGFFNFYPSGVLWTLTVELTFYLVLPAFLVVVRTSRPIGTALLALAMLVSLLASMVLPEAFDGQHPFLDVTVVRYFWIFGIGVMANLFWPNIRRAIEGKFLYWLCLYTAVCVIFPFLTTRDFFTSPTSPEGPVRMLVLAGLLLSAAYTAPSLAQMLRLDKNDYSYGIYLWHMFVVSVLIGLGFRGEWWLWFVVYAGAFIFSAVSWFCVERPTLKLKEWTWLLTVMSRADRAQQSREGRRLTP